MVLDDCEDEIEILDEHLQDEIADLTSNSSASKTDIFK